MPTYHKFLVSNYGCPKRDPNNQTNTIVGWGNPPTKFRKHCLKDSGIIAQLTQVCAIWVTPKIGPDDKYFHFHWMCNRFQLSSRTFSFFSLQHSIHSLHRECPQRGGQHWWDSCFFELSIVFHWWVRCFFHHIPCSHQLAIKTSTAR